MLTNQQIEQFHTQGFLAGGPVLSQDEAGVLQDETLRVIDQRNNANAPQPILLHDMGKPGQPIWQIVNIWEVSQPFKNLVFNEKIVQAVALLLHADQVRLWHDQIQYKPAGKGGVNMWHQDGPYWQPLEPKHEQITAWLALDDADEENGCMSMVPRSHLWGNQIKWLEVLKDFGAMPAEFEKNPVAVKPCPVRKGHVHFHHSLTWHASPENRSGRPRRAIALHYMCNRTIYNARQTHVCKPLIQSADGQPVAGERLPVVWKDGRVVSR